MEDYKKKYKEILERAKRYHKYIKNAITWNQYTGTSGAWVRISDLNLVTTETGSYWFPAQTGRPTYCFYAAFPYEDWMEEYVGTNRMKELLERVFGLTNESDDDRIRKALINVFSTHKDYEVFYGVSVEDIRAWLEKQCEQNTNEIHPIFRVGDYIKNKKTSDKVLIEQLDIATKAYCYVSYDGGAEIHSDFSFSKQDEWMLIGQNIVEQKNAWSEEDENRFRNLIYLVEHSDEGKGTKEGFVKFINRLKSFKDRVLPQSKQEWSGGDEAHLHSLMTHLEQWIERHPNTTGADVQGENISWLKSLKERYTWKPSDEQMKFLWKYAEQNNYDGAILTSLYHDLKKFMEE